MVVGRNPPKAQGKAYTKTTKIRPLVLNSFVLFPFSSRNFLMNRELIKHDE